MYISSQIFITIHTFYYKFISYISFQLNKMYIPIKYNIINKSKLITKINCEIQNYLICRDATGFYRTLRCDHLSKYFNTWQSLQRSRKAVGQTAPSFVKLSLSAVHIIAAVGLDSQPTLYPTSS